MWHAAYLIQIFIYIIYKYISTVYGILNTAVYNIHLGYLYVGKTKNPKILIFHAIVQMLQ